MCPLYAPHSATVWCPQQSTFVTMDTFCVLMYTLPEYIIIPPACCLVNISTRLPKCHITHSRTWVLLEEPPILPAIYGTPKVCSQEPSIGPYTEPDLANTRKKQWSCETEQDINDPCCMSGLLLDSSVCLHYSNEATSNHSHKMSLPVKLIS
jgi:hypothetical protein